MKARSAYGLTSSICLLERALYAARQRKGAVHDVAKVFRGRQARYVRSQILLQNVRQDFLILFTTEACAMLQSGQALDNGTQWKRRKRRPGCSYESIQAHPASPWSASSFQPAKHISGTHAMASSPQSSGALSHKFLIPRLPTGQRTPSSGGQPTQVLKTPHLPPSASRRRPKTSRSARLCR